MMSPGTIWAGLLDETCDGVYKKLASGPNDGLTKANENFSLEGKVFTGCVIRFLGNRQKVTDGQDPGTLLGKALPYCPDGKLPPDTPLDMINEGGWCGDMGADGPDGTFYRALKENVFCIVEGRWDGGDDSDPQYVPSSKYEVIVRCAHR